MATIRIRDDLGRALLLSRPPQRIVSLVPSDTHTLFALGAGDRVVGRTRYCVEPAEAAGIPVVGGTKDVDVAAVQALAPDLVIGNQEENARVPLEALSQAGVRVFVSLPRRFADGVAHVARLARMLGVAGHPAARALIARGYDAVRDGRGAGDDGRGGSGAGGRDDDAPGVFVPIWNDPLMTLNGETFGSDMLACAGARNVFGDRARLYPLAADLGKGAPVDAAGRDTRYPRVSIAEIEARAPAIVLLPDEPYPHGDADVARFAQLPIPAAARGAIALCSGKDLFWYGAWSLEAVPRLQALIARLRR